MGHGAQGMRGVGGGLDAHSGSLNLDLDLDFKRRCIPVRRLAFPLTHRTPHPPRLRLQANAYFVGLGVAKDHALAKSLYEGVMTTEDDERGYAAYRLAVYYDQGLGGSPPEPKSARRLYVGLILDARYSILDTTATHQAPLSTLKSYPAHQSRPDHDLETATVAGTTLQLRPATRAPSIT